MDLNEIIKAVKTKKYTQESSNFKYVSKYIINGTREVYQANIGKFKWCKWYESERTAAIGVDVKFLEKGQKPVNILKRK